MWQAKFNGGEVLNEFNSAGHEILFGKVLERLDTLESLSIILKNKTFTVSMIDSKFSFTGGNGDENHFYAADIDVATLTNIRPIYFIRETVKLALHANQQSFESSSPTVNFIALGFQANSNGDNIKRYLAILPNGSFVIKGE